jgi:hypothetical protein
VRWGAQAVVRADRKSLELRGSALSYR